MSVITLDFVRPLLFIDGKPINEPKQKTEDEDVPVMLNKMLATNLSQTQGGANTLKLFHWALDLYKEGNLKLDKVDRDLLKKTVGDMQISTLVQGRVLEVIEEAEKDAEEAEKAVKEESKPKMKKAEA